MRKVVANTTPLIALVVVKPLADALIEDGLYISKTVLEYVLEEAAEKETK